MLCVQAEQSHGDFCLLCVHRGTWDALVPTSTTAQGVWLVQLVRTAGAAFALHAGQSRHKKLSGTWWPSKQ